MLSKPTLLFHIFRRAYSTESFKDLNVPQTICNNLQRHFGAEKPTVAQSQFIPVIQSGRDLLLRDRTGTGKTFGIAIALASKHMHASQHGKQSQSLYVVPNQELATQIERWMHLLMDGTPANTAAYHVQDTHDSDNSLSAHTLIGTPARLLDAINTLPHIDCIVIEEVDQALRLPTRYAPLHKQKKRAANPKPTQTLVSQLLQRGSKNKKKPQLVTASATLNRPIRHWMRMNGWINHPVFVDITKSVEALSEHMQHYCLFVSGGEIRNMGSFYNIDAQMENESDQQQDAPGEHTNTQTSLIESVAVLNEIENVHNGVLFVDTSVSTPDIQRQLAEYGLRALDIRDYDRDNHKEEDKTPLWIATEFSARGMDIGNVSHVFILGEPKSVGGYVHMAGRTGRLGPQGIRGGKVITLVEDKGKAETRMSNIYKLLNAQVEHYEHVQ